MSQAIGTSVPTKGETQIWLAGSSLAVVLLMVLGLLAVVCINGLGLFWPSRLVQLELADGTKLLGEISAVEAGNPAKTQLRTGNRDIYGTDFVWVEDSKISQISYPEDVLAIERMEWGAFFGAPAVLKTQSGDISATDPAFFDRLDSELRKTQQILAEVRSIERDRIGAISREQEELRLEKSRKLSTERSDEIKRREAELERAYGELESEASDKRAVLTSSLEMLDVSGTQKSIRLEKLVDYYPANRLGFFQRCGRYFIGVWRFVSGEPRESNTEGGVFPAIYGTVLMVVLMSIVTTPLGVITALYLREYSRQGPFVSLVRICVSNLAGVPSIVYGVFGVGFFIYFLGARIDQLFYSDALPAPTFGTGGILWASLTLAILTLPTVIVTTEEGLAAIPRHLREASYALGATKAETVFKVILPALSPAILTGVILATARAAGEVAPLMVTGVVKLAPSLPIDGQWPFLHFDRKFMHLGFHIYDVGFQSPNVEAARPMVFATTVLLLLIVILLNVTAVIVRAKLRKKYSSTAI